MTEVFRRLIAVYIPFGTNIIDLVKGQPDLIGTILIPFLLLVFTTFSGLVIAPFIFQTDYTLVNLEWGVFALVGYIFVTGLSLVLIPGLEQDSLPLESLLITAWNGSEESRSLSFFDHCCILGYSLALYIPFSFLSLIPLIWLRLVLLILIGVWHCYLLCSAYVPSSLTLKIRFAFGIVIVFCTIGLVCFFWFSFFHYNSSSSETFLNILALQQCSRSKPWTIHGLWPAGKTCCSSVPFNLQEINSLIPSLNQFWPTCSPRNENSDFWQHEWTKHGTCSGLSQFDYFQTTLILLQQFSSECTSSAGNCKICLSPQFSLLPINDCPSPSPEDLENC